MRQFVKFEYKDCCKIQYKSISYYIRIYCEFDIFKSIKKLYLSPRTCRYLNATFCPRLTQFYLSC